MLLVTNTASQSRAGTKDAQLSAQAGSRKYCHLEDNVSPVWRRCLSHPAGLAAPHSPGTADLCKSSRKEKHGWHARTHCEEGNDKNRSAMMQQRRFAKNARWNAAGMKRRPLGNAAVSVVAAVNQRRRNLTSVDGT